mgnify:CR=1 FL=1|tara:strand:+ start:15 stop:620 length:606 start_codon:yes stop_codon:yes gene_type:complete
MAIKVANNQSLSAITSIPASITGGDMILLETQTASSSATISFTSNINNTYKEYIFKFISIHPENNNSQFTFNGSIDSGSNYNVTKTTTSFRTLHSEDDGTASVGYRTGADLAQSTAFKKLHENFGGANDECASGYLHLYDPSNTTFVKHFISVINSNADDDMNQTGFTAGYFNTTSALDAVQFKMASDNLDAGTIKMYGIK